MRQKDIQALRNLTTFPALVDYLRDELEWPIEVEDAEDIVFEYEPEELGINPKHAVKIEAIKQIRPLSSNQPWGIFFIEFESKRLPVVVLRRILRALVPASRKRHAEQPVWRMQDLLFVSAQGEPGHRSISFAHFRERDDGRQPELRTFSWDSHESHFYYLKNFNLAALSWPDEETDAQQWRAQWAGGFTVEHRYTITTSQMLAREMARHARIVRELVQEVYQYERESDPLHQLFNSFKKVLLHDLTPESFADMVAQTVAYGLFSAAAQNDQLAYGDLVASIPKTNPFLRELLAELTTQGNIDLEELGVGQLLDLLNQTDLQTITKDFGRRTGSGREDPVVHFYELFLNEYDKEQRVQRGVFYTPDPVVSYIVRSVDHLLRTEFGLEDGLADTSVDPDTGEPLVQILDPATGTGTFLAHVVDQIEETVKAKPGADWNDYVAKHLLPRLNGYELMMAPYAVSHMKLGLKLNQTGYDFKSQERLRVYLTNALEKPVEMHETLAFAGFLSKESNEAARVKSKAPITIIIGNPPYSVTSANSNDYINDLMSLYKRAVRGESGLVALSDDYLKFFRLAHARLKGNEYGIIGLITNRGYLSGIIHRGMRQELTKSFSHIYILDLHGDSNIGEKAPSGYSNENVFDIQQGVSICFLLKKPKCESTKVFYSELWGTRKEKYQFLLSQRVDKTNFSLLTPKPDRFFFVPFDDNYRDEYEKYISIQDIFPINSCGVKTHRDGVVIDIAQDVLHNRMIDIARSKDINGLREKYGIKDTKHWRFSEAKKKISAKPIGNYIKKITYRPFDDRYIYYNRSIIEKGDSKYPTLKHMLQSNIALLAARIQVKDEFNAIFCSKNLVEMKTAESTRSCTVYPLYSYHFAGSENKQTLLSTHEGTREANLSPLFVNRFKRNIGLNFIPDGAGNLEESFGPEDIFHYFYAIFHSPVFRERYKEFLKKDYPRVPLISNIQLFRSLVLLGNQLTPLHLLDDELNEDSRKLDYKNNPWENQTVKFVIGSNEKTIGKFSKSNCYENGRVYLDTSDRKKCSFFDSVPEDTWNFCVGGYQVLHKWLYDRRAIGDRPGYTLTDEDIEHYKKMVVAIQETIRIMGEIDDVIEAHGGWPIQ